MSPVDRLLDLLDGVRQTGTATWMAKCPAHEDRRPSLSIREGDDGRVLIHCFAGCGATDVVAAVGLDLVDLFPPNLDGDYDRRNWKRRGGAPRIPAADALRTLDGEAFQVACMAAKLVECGLLTDIEVESMRLATDRIAAVRAAWEYQP